MVRTVVISAWGSSWPLPKTGLVMPLSCQAAALPDLCNRAIRTRDDLFIATALYELPSISSADDVVVPFRLALNTAVENVPEGKIIHSTSCLLILRAALMFPAWLEHDSLDAVVKDTRQGQEPGSTIRGCNAKDPVEWMGHCLGMRFYLAIVDNRGPFRPPVSLFVVDCLSLGLQR